MCFNIDSNNPDKQIAEKDITCYKVMFKKDNNSYLSQFKSFEYKKDENYEINKWSFGMPQSIEVGFHFHSNIETARDSLAFWNTCSIAPPESLNLVIIECIIPKGSEYYHNPIEHEYVSNRIKIIGQAA